MRPSRRWILAAGAAVLAGGGAVGASAGNGWIRSVLERAFGAEIAGAPAVEAFLADYAASLSLSGRAALRIAELRHRIGLRGAPETEVLVVTAFARTTNAVRVAEAGEALVYLGLGSPYEQPCRNPLSSHWL